MLEDDEQELPSQSNTTLCEWYVYMCLHTCVCVPVCARGSQRSTEGICLTFSSPHSFDLKTFVFFLIAWMYLCWVYAHDGTCLGGQQRVSAPQELELQAVLSRPMSVLGIQVLGTISALHH